MSQAIDKTCPHCGAGLVPFSLPDTLYDHPHDLACFNDECPYYRRGWTWMEEQYGVTSSYRYRVDSRSGRASPLAVWSPAAIRDRILGGEAPGAGREAP
jgi:hypothetical protein